MAHVLQRTWIPPALIVGVVVLVCAIIGGLAVGGGKERYSPASLSKRESRAVGAFVREVAISDVSPSEFSHTIKEAWSERIYERYESIPLNKRVAGMRLCIVCDNSRGECSGCYCKFQAAPAVKDFGGGSVFSGSVAVFHIDMYLPDEFPLGVASVHKENDSLMAKFKITNMKDRE